MDITEHFNMPDIEESVPLPKNAREAIPDLSPTDELTMRANVVKLFSDMTGQPIEPSQANVDEATELAKEMMTNPMHRPNFSKYPNETLAMLAGMVAQTNVAIVDDLADLKLYVVNNLIKEYEMAKDPKVKLTALSKLGEVDGVDAFKKRTEITHKIMSKEEVEAELMATLDKIQGRIIDAEARDITHESSHTTTQTSHTTHNTVS
jgi:hypothetical protein